MPQFALLSAIYATVLFALPSPAVAQDSIPKLIRIVVPFSPGASNDAIARALAGPLAKRLDISVIVENKPGAAGVVGADAVAKSPRDGSVLLLTSSTFLTTAATHERLPYDVLTSFAPVATVGQNPSILAVSAATPFKSTADLFAAARAKPGEITYGSAGVGSIGHMVTERMSAAAGIQMRHVPYKGAALAAIDLAGGQIQVMKSSYGSLSPFLKSEKVRLLAVTSRQPHPSFPGVPPLNATLPGFSSETWVAIFAPAGTSPRIIERLNREITEISASPELKTLFDPDGMLPLAMTPAAFSTRMQQELAQWKQIVTERKIVAE
ncbi:MAG TPA: tripartite tricarboxylate transporter substrate-binding protein [Burkholderiales bacterium]|nr:tripartite tricarboxylate transporter substrate-binding protein [Burkholderiales bacterium]